MRVLLIFGLLLSVASQAYAQGQAPNRKDVVEAVSAADPARFACAHVEGRSCKHDWIKAVAAALHATDPKWGLNGKRGNPSDISMDVVTYRIGPTDRHVQAFDICGSCGGGSPSVVWNDITNWATIGQPGTAIWIQPGPVSGPAPPVVDTTGTWTAAHAEILRRLGSSDTKRIAEQLRSSFPAQEWGQKRADSARPISGDVIAVRANGRLTGVRVVPASSAGVIGDISGQMFVAVAAVDHLGAGVVTPPPVPTPTPEPSPSPSPTPSPVVVSLQPVLDAIAALAAKVDALEARAAAVVDLSEVTARIDAVSVQVDQARQEIGALASKPIAVDWPEYSGVLLGQRVTLRPRR